MSSQPSQAHIKAVDMVESHAYNTLEEEIKRIVERQGPFIHDDGKTYENTMIEQISQQVKGKK